MKACKVREKNFGITIPPRKPECLVDVVERLKLVAAEIAIGNLKVVVCGDELVVLDEAMEEVFIHVSCLFLAKLIDVFVRNMKEVFSIDVMTHVKRGGEDLVGVAMDEEESRIGKHLEDHSEPGGVQA